MLAPFTRLLLLAFCTLAPALASWAQDFPLDPATGKIYYAEEVLVMDGPKTDLFHRARTWLLAAKPSQKALQVADAPNGVLIARTYSLLPGVDGDSRRPCKLWHTIKIEVENDRYWYSLSDFKVQWAPDATSARKSPERQYPLEAFVLPQASSAKRAYKRPVDTLLAEKAGQRIATLIADLKASML